MYDTTKKCVNLLFKNIILFNIMSNTFSLRCEGIPRRNFISTHRHKIHKIIVSIKSKR